MSSSIVGSSKFKLQSRDSDRSTRSVLLFIQLQVVAHLIVVIIFCCFEVLSGWVVPEIAAKYSTKIGNLSGY